MVVSSGVAPIALRYTAVVVGGVLRGRLGARLLAKESARTQELFAPQLIGWSANQAAILPQRAYRMLTSDLPTSRRVNKSWGHKSSKKPLIGQRILLAEDEALIALEMRHVLEDLGCDVVGPLASVDKILEEAHRGNLDGALLDINLRGRQIFEVLPKLQKLGLRLIITSGYDDVTLFPATFRAVPRIAKPFAESELRWICEKVFANPVTR
jgi:CheY-like chemotaxis protein